MRGAGADRQGQHRDRQRRQLDIDGRIGPGRKCFSPTGRPALDRGHRRLPGEIGLTDYGGNRSRSTASGEVGVLRGRRAHALPQEEPGGCDQGGPVGPADQPGADLAVSRASNRRFAATTSPSRPRRGGTVMTYAPRGPNTRDVAPGARRRRDRHDLSLKSLLLQAFGTKAQVRGDDPPSGKAAHGQGDLLGPAGRERASSPFSRAGSSTASRSRKRPRFARATVTFLVGNNIAFPPQLRVQVTEESKGGRPSISTTQLWAVDPRSWRSSPGSGHTPGKPFRPTSSMPPSASGRSTAASSTPSCATGSPTTSRPAPARPCHSPTRASSRAQRRRRLLADRLSRARRGQPVSDWNTWSSPATSSAWAGSSRKPATGHTTTVLAVRSRRHDQVYDNIDIIDGERIHRHPRRRHVLDADRSAGHHDLPPRSQRAVPDQRHDVAGASSRAPSSTT